MEVMPYHLEKKDHKFVVADAKGKHYSKHGIPKENALKQMIALNIAHARSEGYKIPRK
jgi:hypothetical protein